MTRNDERGGMNDEGRGESNDEEWEGLYIKRGMGCESGRGESNDE